MKHNQLDRKQRYGIRKFTVGAASVVIGAVVFGASPVLAQEATATNKETTELGVEKDQAEKAVDTEKSATESNGVDTVTHTGTETTATAETVEATRETEKDPASLPRDYYARELENVNTVLEKEDVETNAANSNRIDLTEQLDKLKQLQNATIHMEFKPDTSAPAFYNLFSVSSDTVRNEYFTMAVYNNVALTEGRDQNGDQFYDRYTDAPLTVKPGQWN